MHPSSPMARFFVTFDNFSMVLSQSQGPSIAGAKVSFKSSNRIKSIFLAMDLLAKIRTIPTEPGVYLYKNAEGEVIYVGKAKNLRSRVASYFHEGRWEDSKTGTLVREAVDVDYIVVANNKEALALENNLIKQRKPRFNILLRDDKTYPYVKLTLGERWPRVYVTRRLRKDGSAYYGPYFPANLAYRIVDLIHRNFLIPSCKVDLTRFHPRPCLQYYIKRCLGPCVKDLTTPEALSGSGARREAVSGRPSHRLEPIAYTSAWNRPPPPRSTSAQPDIAT